MVLQKQVVPVPLAGGLDTKTDQKQVQPGKLLVAENVIMPQTGALSKADGTTTISAPSGGTSGTQISVLDNELSQVASDFFYAYSQTRGNWTARGAYTNCMVSTTPLATGTSSLQNPVMAIANNIAVYAWEDTGVASSFVFYTVVDLVSNSTIIAPTQASSSLSSPRAITQGQYIFLSWLTAAAGVQYYIFDSLSPATTPSVKVASLAASTTVNYDICAFQGGMAFVHSTAIGDLFGYIYSTSGTLVTGAVNLSINIGTPPASPVPAASLVILSPGDSSATLSLLYSKTGTGLSHAMLNSTLGFYKTSVVIDAGSGASNFSAVYDGQGRMRIVYNNKAASLATNQLLISYGFHTISTNIYSGSAPIGNSLITSRIFAFNSRYYCLSGYETTNLSGTVSTDGLQTSNFLISPDQSGSVQAAILPNGKSGPIAYIFPTPVAYGASKIMFPILQKTSIISDNGTLFTVASASTTTLNFSASQFPAGQQLGPNLYLPGGYLKTYDGEQIVEAGFHLWPDITLQSQSTVGGNLAPNPAPAGYSYRAVYEWRDANGQLQQSSPTFPALTVPVPAGTSTNQVTIRVRALNFTNKKDVRDVALVLYRSTIASPTTYYRCSVTLATTPKTNTSAVRQTGYLDITDTDSDTVISASQILYTVGGELENINAPAPSVVLAFKNRIFTVTGEDPSAIYYSKEISPRNAPGFNDSLRISVNPQYGPITALGPLDDKLVIFKASAIYVLAGDGPLPNGQQNNFSNAGKLSSDVGCSNQASVVETPLGLMFQSAKGIYLLDRSLTVQYVGSAVESFNALTVTGSFVLAAANQVRFTTTAGTTLVYDYIQNIWTVRTGEASVGSVLWNGEAAFLRSNAQVAYEVAGQAGVDSSAFLTKVKTGFYSFAGLQGFQRVWRILVLGEFRGNHILKVTVYTDFKATADDTFYVAVGDSAFCTQINVLSVTTQTATFLGTSADPAYQFAVKPRVQKCESMAVQIEDVDMTFAGLPQTKAFNVSSVSFEVGVKGTLKRLSTSANMLKG